MITTWPCTSLFTTASTKKTGVSRLGIYGNIIIATSDTLLRWTTFCCWFCTGMNPSMKELESLHFINSDGSRQEVSVLDECSKKNLGESFRKIFGITSDKIHHVVRERPMFFCHSVFLRWHNEGSTPPSTYPISWMGMMKAMEHVGLSVAAKQVRTALLEHSWWHNLTILHTHSSYYNTIWFYYYYNFGFIITFASKSLL